MDSTKALSRYSDLVDEVIRKQMAKLEGATDEARLRLKQYELPELLDSVTTTGPAMIPEGVKKDLEEIEQCGGLGYLQDVDPQYPIAISGLMCVLFRWSHS